MVVISDYTEGKMISRNPSTFHCYLDATTIAMQCSQFCGCTFKNVLNWPFFDLYVFRQAEQSEQNMWYNRQF